MKYPDFLGKGWAFPVQTQAGKVCFASAEEDIQQALIIIICTAKGQRVMLPEFGCEINELMFAPNNTATLNLAALYVRQSIDRWEPRVQVQTVSVTVAETNRACLLIEVNYIIRDKNVPAI